MCVVSMITEHYIDKWGQYTKPYTSPNTWPNTNIPNTVPWPLAPNPPYKPDPEEMQRQLEEFKKLIERAKEYDRKNNEPDCELDEKQQALKAIAEQLGVKIEFPK